MPPVPSTCSLGSGKDVTVSACLPSGDMTVSLRDVWTFRPIACGSAINFGLELLVVSKGSIAYYVSSGGVWIVLSY